MTNPSATSDHCDILSFLGCWLKDHPKDQSLDLFIKWGIWRAINAITFENIPPNIWETSCNIFSFYLEYSLVNQLTPQSPSSPCYIWSSFPMGSFYCASSFDSCGCGMVIYLSPKKIYRSHWHCGFGSNSRA